MNKYDEAVQRWQRKFLPQLCAELENKDTQYFLFEAMGTLRLDRDAIETLREMRALTSGMYAGFVDAIGMALDGYEVYKSDGTTYRYKLK